MSRASILMATTLATATMAVTAVWHPLPKLIWNASASVPVGLYIVRPVGRLSVGQLVIVHPPEPLASWMAEGGYLPNGLPLLKHVAALPGARVCRQGVVVRIDSRPVAVARERDHAGRQLPLWDGCHQLVSGEVFLLNPNQPASLDGRYFGPSSAQSIVGRAVPIWTMGAP